MTISPTLKEINLHYTFNSKIAKTPKLLLESAVKYQIKFS